MSLARPGPGRCDVCGERVPARHPFLIQVKNVGASTNARTTALVNVVGAHCEACDRHFRVFRARRLQAIATMVLAALLYAPLMLLASALAGGAGPIIALVIAAAMVVLALARVATWHDQLRDELGAALLDDIGRGLPDPPGILRWSEVRVFPSLPHGVELHHALDDLRHRAEHTRELPN